jgi:23S rRNA pseudouridine1911/1915/1917 synthase
LQAGSPHHNLKLHHYQFETGVRIGWDGGAMAIEQTHHIGDSDANQTVAAIVRKLRGENVSWSEAKRLVLGRHVQVNGNLCVDEGRRLKRGEVIKLFKFPRAAMPGPADIRIRHRDNDLVVIEKPAGVTTLRHAEERGWSDRRKQRQLTLDEMLQAALSSGSQGKKGKALHGKRPTGPRVRAVHRLDRDTSGLMLFALSAPAEQALVHAFKNHKIARSYLAVVHGKMEACTIESYIARDRGDGLRGSSTLGKSAAESQHAVTHVKPIRTIADRYTLVSCRLETGRTHQIRIHLSERGHMICGEKVYVRSAAGAPVQKDSSGAPRQALHSAELSFVHPMTGKTIRFTAPLPADLDQWIKALES